MLKVFSRASEMPLEFALCILLAAVPSIIWIWIFNRKHHEKKAAIVLSFVLGIGSAFIVLLYQYYWGKNFNMGFFRVEAVNFQQNIDSNFTHPILVSALVFLSVGFMEEFSKHWVIKKADQKYFRSVDDVIELSIVAALGFAFLENIGYFFFMILRGQQEHLLQLFVMRSSFVVFIHILCSGIYGYFYGVGYFAKEIFLDEEKAGKKFFIPEFFHRVFHMRADRVFHDEMVSLGLIISILVHGLYDFLLDINLTLGGVIGVKSLEHIGFHYVTLPIFLIIGFWWLSKKIDNKEDQKVFGRRIVMEEYDVADKEELEILEHKQA